MYNQMRQYGVMILGTLMIALCFTLFLIPNEIASGGLPGASLVISSVIEVETSIVLWIISIGILLGSRLFLSWGVVVKSVIGSLLVPFFVNITYHVTPLTSDPLLAAIYGGLGIGVGLGIILRSQGNIGGFTLIAIILHKYKQVKPSTTILVLDSIVIVSAGLIYSPEKALYALLGIFLMRKTMDFILQTKASKMAYIISSVEYENTIKDAVLYELDRGLTKISGQGGYSTNERIIMMTVLHPTKANQLKAMIQSIDPSAFIIFCDATEVVGEGFTEAVQRTQQPRTQNQLATQQS
ncbi:YitT family protein [Alkalihalobacillus sp. LMS39]|uniref:YitT family protein n=1 Tax=Alkalihalobacillus sp. LMS39 TaxID=2924032 RepID=UPI001FB436E8|nr:YitT family protein [Alkalihalobacillus sp. LMS39]UOE96168.1 YitT family protein [Alkalihalobacillus sp. LMS39]